MKKTVKWILTVMSILVMAFIFIMSAQSASKSSDESSGIGRIIGQIIFRDFKDWTSSEQVGFVAGINHSVRKLAHFIEFAVLGSVFHLTLSAWGMKPNVALPVSFGAGAFYAATDEFHQLFVEGRSAEFTDVLLDSAGVAFGCLVVWLILTAVLRRRAKKGEAAASASGT